MSKKQLKEIQRQKELQQIPEDEEGDDAINDVAGGGDNDSNHNAKRPRRRRKPSLENHAVSEQNGSVDEGNDGTESKVGYEQMEGGFFFDDHQDDPVVVDDESKERSERKENGKEERSDSEEELASRPLRALQDAQMDEDDDKESADGQMDENLYLRLQEANEFHQFPRNVGKMTAKDIAALPGTK